LHHKLGHADIQRIQRLCRPVDDDTAAILVTKHATTGSCIRPLCAACQLGKRGKTPAGKLSGQQPQRSNTLRQGHLNPGDRVSINQYVSAAPGRRLDTQGRKPPAKRYNGGTLFVDHASGFVFVKHQILLQVGETVQAKRSFEQLARSCGVAVKGYNADNAPFAYPEFQADVQAKGQTIDFSGVGAHHQNAVAETAIKTITGWACTMLLHSMLHWPDQADLQLWPFTMMHAAYLWNHLPQHDNLLAPVEIFSSTKFDNYNHLHRAHVWGAPVYVLDPTLQDGKKLPKWHPCTRRGMYMGVSVNHSSRVSMVLNLRTGYVLPQYHVVHDDLFTTVPSTNTGGLAESDELDRAKWIKLVEDGYENVLDDADVDNTSHYKPQLDNDWLTPNELATRQEQRQLQRER
jgi:hypothetical protein